MNTRSIRFKIVRGTSILLATSLVLALTVVTKLQLQATEENVEKLEQDIRKRLEFEGALLAREHAAALRVPFEDNSLIAVQELILRSVKENENVVYGFVVDADLMLWAMTDDQRDSARPKDEDADRLRSFGIRDGYLEIASLNPKRIKKINASNSIHNISDEIYQLVKPLILQSKNK